MLAWVGGWLKKSVGYSSSYDEDNNKWDSRQYICQLVG